MRRHHMTLPRLVIAVIAGMETLVSVMAKDWRASSAGSPILNISTTVSEQEKSRSTTTQTTTETKEPGKKATKKKKAKKKTTKKGKTTSETKAHPPEVVPETDPMSPAPKVTRVPN